MIMEYTDLGTSGLKVSQIAPGCMSFGEHRGFSEWSLGEEEAGPFFAQAVIAALEEPYLPQWPAGF
jgi:1-deoxyxylulose-5-phosphate synthase